MASGAAPPGDQQILDIISSIPNMDTTDANGQNLDDSMDELFGSMNGDVEATLANNLFGENGSQSANGSNAIIDDIFSKVSQVEQPALRILVDGLQTQMISPMDFAEGAKRLLTFQAIQTIILSLGLALPDADRKRVNSSDYSSDSKRARMESESTGLPASMGPPIGSFSRQMLQQQGMSMSLSPGQSPPPNSLGLSRSNSGVLLPGARGATLSRPVNSQAPGEEKTDMDKLTDAVGSAGVDLKAEEENILQDSEGLRGRSTPAQTRRTPIEAFLEPNILRAKVASVAKAHDLKNLDNEFLTYISMAAETRIRALLEKMVDASRHRISSTHLKDPPLDASGNPVYKEIIKRDVKKQLLAIERVEREQEIRRKDLRAERERIANGEGGDEDGMMTSEGAATPTGERPRKKKKEGPGQAAKNMSEDVRTRLSNQAALLSAGGAVKSWMMSGTSKKLSNPSSPAPSSPAISSPKPNLGGLMAKNGSLPGTPTGGSRPGISVLGRGTPGSAGKVTAGSFIRNSGSKGVLPPNTHASQMGGAVVTLRDALFVLEQEVFSEEAAGSGRRALMRGYIKRQE